jgi:hypothetical protein
VAIHADHVALGDLGGDRLQSIPLPDKIRDIRRLVSSMIELEHHRIALAALDAWIGNEVGCR